MEEHRNLLTTRLDMLTNTINILEKKNANLQTTVRATEIEMDDIRQAWRREVSALSTAVEDVTLRERRLLRNVESLEHALADTEMDYTTRASQVEALQKSIAEEHQLRLRHQNMAEKRYIQLKKDLEHANIENTNLVNVAGESSHTIDALELKLLQVLSENDRLSNIVQEKENTARSLEDIVTKISQQIDQVCPEGKVESDMDDVLQASTQEVAILFETNPDVDLEQLLSKVAFMRDELVMQTENADNWQAAHKEWYLKYENLRADVENLKECMVNPVQILTLHENGDFKLQDLLDISLKQFQSRVKSGDIILKPIIADKKTPGSEANNLIDVSREGRVVVEIVDAKQQQGCESVSNREVVCLPSPKDDKQENVRADEVHIQLEEQVKTLTQQMKDIVDENDSASSQFADVIMKLKAERDDLASQMYTMRTRVSEEREQLMAQLTERTEAFAKVEAELKDAREIYIAAANGFEKQRVSLSRRLSTSEREKMKVEQGLAEADQLVDDRVEELEALTKRCGTLVAMNNQLLVEKHASDDKASSLEIEVEELELKLCKVGRSKEALKEECVMAEEREERLRRKIMDMGVEKEQREAETEKLRREMSEIHGRMRRMAHMSMPAGSEELLADDDDLRKLEEIREATRKQEEAEREGGGERKMSGRSTTKRVRLGGIGNQLR